MYKKIQLFITFILHDSCFDYLKLILNIIKSKISWFIFGIIIMKINLIIFLVLNILSNFHLMKFYDFFIFLIKSIIFESLILIGYNFTAIFLS